MRTDFLVCVCVCGTENLIRRTEIALDGGESQVSKAPNVRNIERHVPVGTSTRKNIGQGAAETRRLFCLSCCFLYCAHMHGLGYVIL